MNHLLMTICGIAFIFLMTTLGAALVFCFKKEFSPRLNAAFFGLASGIMLAASVWSLLLPAMEQAEGLWKRAALFPVVVAFLFGGVVLLFLDNLFPSFQKSKNRFGKLFLAVSLHNIPEGLAVGFAFGVASSLGTPAAYASALSLAVGVGVQNLPEGAAVSLPMRALYGSKGKGFLFGMLSGLPEPVFAILGYFLAAQIRSLQPWLLAFSAGAMIFVVIDDMIPEMKSQESGRISLGSCCAMLGFAIMMTLDVILG